MPDWTYQTVFQPLLFRLPTTMARTLALGTMGALARLPLGTVVIDFFGHMAPDPKLACKFGSLRFSSPVGLGTGIDPTALATAAFSRFGLGFFEIGPITERPHPASTPAVVDARGETLTICATDENAGVETTAARLANISDRFPLIVRLPSDTAEACIVVNRLASLAAAFSCSASTTQSSAFEELIQLCARHDKPVLLVVPASDDSSHVAAIADHLAAERVIGLLIDGSLQPDGHRTMNAAAFKACVASVRRWRGRLGSETLLIASGGIHEPSHALELLKAGASLLQIDSGLVFSGPGLPKRINEAIVHYQKSSSDVPQPPTVSRPAQQAWFWGLMMGISMVVGGLLAMVIAATRVVLPYDEAMTGMTRDEIASSNDRLLHFMQHDRITLAGTMLAVGILYCALSWWGIRRGWHWALRTVAVSAFAGFFSFFTFLAFGYFDPFHAFVTAILFQFLLLMISSEYAPLRLPDIIDLHNDWRWKCSQWGQLLFVMHGTAIIVAGIVIAAVGSTSVFVPEDLEFLETNAQHLMDTHPGLVPLVAHDRATFGGMLIACGLAVLLPSMWGFRRGHAWLWWTLVTAGTIAYFATIAVHWHVHYTSLKHLIPAYGGLAALWIGGCLSYPYLCQREHAS
jgi:dihydroorotate dehydrogenase